MAGKGYGFLEEIFDGCERTSTGSVGEARAAGEEGGSGKARGASREGSSRRCPAGLTEASAGVRWHKVLELRARIHNGTYFVGADELAGSLCVINR